MKAKPQQFSKSNLGQCADTYTLDADYVTLHFQQYYQE